VTPDPQAPLVAIVVLNYNGRDHLGYCLPSLAATTYPNYRLIVVDNASPDGSAAMVAALTPAAIVHASTRNLGWSGGNNVGIRAALQLAARYVVLANNDIKVDPRWLQCAVDVAERDSRIAVIGFHVIEPEPGCADPDATFRDAMASWRALEIQDPGEAGGMAMFVRAEAFERLGLIDEGFFAYGEENDFERRAIKAGLRVVATNVPVWHYGQAAFGKIPRRAAMLQVRSNIRLLIKHGSPAQLLRSALTHLSRRIVSRAAATPSAVEGRLRGSRRADAVWFLAWGVLWNLWMLPATLRRRQADNRRSALTRRHHYGSGVAA
jgi:GT2 family glycosyltransferase